MRGSRYCLALADAPPTITPSPTNHPLTAQREQAKIQDDGQGNAKYDADDYPEQTSRAYTTH